jgi:hypothetical protein
MSRVEGECPITGWHLAVGCSPWVKHEADAVLSG